MSRVVKAPAPPAPVVPAPAFAKGKAPVVEVKEEPRMTSLEKEGKPKRVTHPSHADCARCQNRKEKEKAKAKTLSKADKLRAEVRKELMAELGMHEDLPAPRSATHA